MLNQSETSWPSSSSLRLVSGALMINNCMMGTNIKMFILAAVFNLHNESEIIVRHKKSFDFLRLCILSILIGKFDEYDFFFFKCTF